MGNVLKSWRLFWSLLAADSIAICIRLPKVDFSSRPSVEGLILRTVLCALPCLVVAFLASPLARLWPGRFTRWLLSNRRYIGLAFAAGMIWHFTFVGYFFWAFGYDMAPQDITLDVIGVLFLCAMTVTSFPKFRSGMTSTNWHRLHRAGIYTLWFLPTFFFFRDFVRDRSVFHGVALGGLLIVLAVRAAGRVFSHRLKPMVQQA